MRPRLLFSDRALELPTSTALVTEHYPCRVALRRHICTFIRDVYGSLEPVNMEIKVFAASSCSLVPNFGSPSSGAQRASLGVCCSQARCTKFVVIAAHFVMAKFQIAARAFRSAKFMNQLQLDMLHLTQTPSECCSLSCNSLITPDVFHGCQWQGAETQALQAKTPLFEVALLALHLQNHQAAAKDQSAHCCKLFKFRH